MIVFASDGYIHQIKELWCQAFGDTKQGADFYFSNLHQNENMLIDVEGNNVTSMLTMHPITLVNHKKTLYARYIYAVATHKDFRMQGRSTRLIMYAHEYMRAQNIDASILVPENEGLFDFYEKRHYKRAFYLNKSVFCAEKISAPQYSYSFDVCSVKEYFDIRKEAFGKCSAFAMWDEDMLVKVMAYARFLGGEFYKIFTGDIKAAAYIVRDKDDIIVKELASPTSEHERILSAIKESFDAKKYIIYGAPRGKNDIARGMICNLNNEKDIVDDAYFNLFME